MCCHAVARVLWMVVRALLCSRYGVVDGCQGVAGIKKYARRVRVRSDSGWILGPEKTSSCQGVIMQLHVYYEWLIVCCYAVGCSGWLLTGPNEWVSLIFYSLDMPRVPPNVLRRVCQCMSVKCMISLTTVSFSAYIRTFTETEADLLCVNVCVSLCLCMASLQDESASVGSVIKAQHCCL